MCVLIDCGVCIRTGGVNGVGDRVDSEDSNLTGNPWKRQEQHAVQLETVKMTH